MHGERQLCTGWLCHSQARASPHVEFCAVRPSDMIGASRGASRVCRVAHRMLRRIAQQCRRSKSAKASAPSAPSALAAPSCSVHCMHCMHPLHLLRPMRPVLLVLHVRPLSPAPSAPSPLHLLRPCRPRRAERGDAAPHAAERHLQRAPAVDPRQRAWPSPSRRVLRDHGHSGCPGTPTPPPCTSLHAFPDNSMPSHALARWAHSWLLSRRRRAPGSDGRTACLAG